MLDIDLVVRRLFCVIARDEQLLIELFARAQTCFDNIDIDIGFIAGKADQILGKVEDLDGLAHVQHEQLVLLRHGARLEHKRRSLGNGHEIADDARVRHGDGAARGDLALEERDDRAV